MPAELPPPALCISLSFPETIQKANLDANWYFQKHMYTRCRCHNLFHFGLTLAVSCKYFRTLWLARHVQCQVSNAPAIWLVQRKPCASFAGAGLQFNHHVTISSVSLWSGTLPLACRKYSQKPTRLTKYHSLGFPSHWFCSAKVQSAMQCPGVLSDAVMLHYCVTVVYLFERVFFTVSVSL